MRLRDKRIIVTGAARGIGLATAIAATAEGAQVWMTDLDPAVLDAARAHGCEGVVQDIADEEGWAALIAKVGRVDGLVNNAALQIKYAPLEMPDSEWETAHAVNLKAVWQGCRAVLPGMIAQQSGAIVNLASIHGQQIIPGGFPYSVMKAGVLGLTRALGVEYAASGVRVVAVSPGYIDTDPEWWAEPGALEAVEAKIPARRLGTPDEVAMTIVFLLSDEARYITATTIEIDGGRLALYHE